jgi:hypothetical protein
MVGATIRAMKTDVIFLGAGASVSAGFPTNEELANKIIYDLPKRDLPNDVLGRRRDHLRDTWVMLGEKLRRDSSPSVDEFCENYNTVLLAGNLAEMKKMVRLVLSDSGANWFASTVDYKRLTPTLFSDPRSLNPRFAVINFNYDGLFGKMLADAVHERRQAVAIAGDYTKELAAIAGGFYSLPNDPVLAPPIVGDMENAADTFVHCMPHGTITVAKAGEGLLSIMNGLYASEGASVRFPDGSRLTRDQAIMEFYSLDSAIHFPWEQTASLPIYDEQIKAAELELPKARRLHFIGLSGHRLMRHTLRKLFRNVNSEAAFKDFEWHVATKDPNIQRVFDGLLNCILPDELVDDDGLRDGLHKKMTPHTSFEDWLKVSPHCPRP